MKLNPCLPFEPHELRVILVEYEMYLCLFIFTTWIPRWVTDGNGYEDFLRISSLVINQLTIPVAMEAPWSYLYLFPLARL
jgi:hypothetical protein